MANCKGCGKSIIWAKDMNGRAVPLDPTPPVYAVTTDDANEFVLARANQKFNTEAPMYLVTHFATCPRANDFSRGKRAAQENAPGTAREKYDGQAAAAGEDQ